MKSNLLTGLLLTLFSSTAAELKNLSLNGGIEDGKARLVIEAQLNGLADVKEKPLFATTLQHLVQISRDKHTHTLNATFEVIQGEPKEFPLLITGEGEIKRVIGENLQDWSVRQETNGTRWLVLRPSRSNQRTNHFAVTITAERERGSSPNPVRVLSLAPAQTALFQGFLKVEIVPELNAQPTNSAGLIPIESNFLPEELQVPVKSVDSESLAFRFQGSAYRLSLILVSGDPEFRRVSLHDFQLKGELAGQAAMFTLTTVARVKNPRGGSVNLLSGDVALAELEQNPDWRVRFLNGQFVLVFDKPGEFPIHLKFNAAVRDREGWKRIDFRIAPAALAPFSLQGPGPDTQFEFAGASRPERFGSELNGFLPPDGGVHLSWRDVSPEVEGKLFYSAEMLSQIRVSPGLMRQLALIDGKIMQGELSRLTLSVRGSGNITAVQGSNVLSWVVEPVANSADRRLLIQFNESRKDTFALQIQMQTELSAFPQTIETMQIRPEGATRFAGYLRVVNEGAVRLEVVQANGLSQISPEQFPETDATKALFGPQPSQRFAYRFSSADPGLRIQADNVLPELGISQLIEYHLGETELAIDAEFELDIREAPLREVLVRVPKGFVIARLNAANLSDYFLREPEGQTNAELRLVYGQPISQRQVIQLRLERNAALGLPTWALPRLEVTQAKSTRGHIAVSADAGFRLTPERTVGLTDIATAFYPRKVAGIQAAFRLTEPAWEASLRAERLPQSIQADVFHLFSVGEGFAYGSSTMNFFISGAPISAFVVSLSEEYFNVEFNGKDLRGNWRKTTNGYLVTLNTPVSGSYTLLATYERPFKGQGDTLTFTGARPLDAANEQGHVIIVSAYQFQVKPANVSLGLLPLEPAEVPAQYRLFFDAPILAAYHYTARPFNLQLALSPLAQGETVGLIVDRAVLATRVSRDGEVLTDARYFVKNRGNPHLRVTLPPGTTLWSAMVNNAAVVPVKTGNAHLISLPQHADPNSVQTLDLKLASRSTTPNKLSISVPVVNAPILLADWKIEPDTGQRLVYRRGSLAPEGGISDVSGFAGLARMLRQNPEMRAQLFLGVVLILFALFACKWAIRPGTHRFEVRHIGGSLVTIVALVLAYIVFLTLWDGASRIKLPIARSLNFLAPVQQTDSALTVEVSNLTMETTLLWLISVGWPAILALIIWPYTFLRLSGGVRFVGVVVGWTLLAWTALQWPNGSGPFFGLVGVFLICHVLVPAMRALWQVPPKPALPPSEATVPVTAILLWGALLSAGLASPKVALAAATDPGFAESLIQDIRVEDRFVMATARIHWQASRNQSLPLLSDPAVLTQITYPSNALKLIEAPMGTKRGHQLLAQNNGSYDVEMHYQLRVSQKDGESGFTLPTHRALINRLTLTLPRLDVDVTSTNAVSIERHASSTNTTVDLILAPALDSWIGWKPRSRDLKNEKPVFFVELTQLYVPTVGAIEGVHQVQVRLAQGEVSDLTLNVPSDAIITDVQDQAKSLGISLWRFDPDTRRLRVSLTTPQSRTFTFVIRSQLATGPLPVEKKAGLLVVHNATRQFGSLGIATGPDVQLDSLTADSLSPINLEDFPQTALKPLRVEIPGLTLRRAFRYTDGQATISLKAVAVEPDVRIETQETLSLGEDRSVLALNAAAIITRAGIFRMSFLLPPGLDVESVSGAALSHWTELNSPEGRIITLHLKGKTEGQQQFAIALSGPGTKAMTNFAVPRVAFREASKQTGQIAIVPEQGMRLQVTTREGVTQLDPQKAGIRQKGVLAFRLLQETWKLALDIEQVEPWVQVASLQHITLSEAQAKVTANLQYQIENTGLKAFRIRVPTNAENVRFRGEQVADFLRVPNQITNDLQTWEIKLHRRMIGKYLLQATWQTPISESSTNLVMRGITALDANLQRGFVTVQSAGRIQARTGPLPAALQPAEWQSIPRNLRQDIEAATADYTFRLVEPAYQLLLAIERHEATKLLSAHVNNVTLTSVISDEGVMLTQVKLELIPGDKRLLNLTLPSGARFWFAFVNQNGAWPWREQERILIPLEQQSRADKLATVEFFYSSRIGNPASRKLDLQLLGPQVDLPLENITWRIFLDEKWRLAHWSGTLQLEEDTSVIKSADVKTYLENEVSLTREKTKAAEEMLQAGNTLLERGDPQQARRAFQSAFGLSTHDDAFNEDARVQLHNLKLQEALVGLNVRQSTSPGETGNLRDLKTRKEINYTQQEAKQLIDSNTADENAALTRLAERLVQQQDAAVTVPTGIRATIPEQGRLLVFRRAVQVDTWTDLRIRLETIASRTAPMGIRLVLLATVFTIFGTLIWCGGMTGIKGRSSIRTL